MPRHMRQTTVRLEESLLERAKQEAERRGGTVTALIEEGLRTVLSRPREKTPKRYRVPVMNARGGLKSGLEWKNLEAAANRFYDEEKRLFFANASIEELAAAQNIKPVKTAAGLATEYPDDEDVDTMLEEIYASRK